MHRGSAQRNRDAGRYFEQVTAEEGGIIRAAPRHQDDQVNLTRPEKFTQSLDFIAFCGDGFLERRRLLADLL
jgi:hypothetical protein